MQIRLLQPEPLVPLPVDSGHYVAALQNHAGELDALKHASAQTWELMTPLVQFVGPKKPDGPLTASRVAGWVKRLADAVGSHPFYLDVMRLPPTWPVATTEGEVPVLKELYGSARRRQLRFVPVAWVSESSDEHLALVADAALEDGDGVALRYRIRTVVPPAGTSHEEQLRSVLTALGRAVDNADLLIDLDYIDPDVDLNAGDTAALLNGVMSVGPWRSVVLLGTSMPRTLKGIPEQSLGSLARREWELWSQLDQLGVARMPAFGDYAVQFPWPPQENSGPGMRANVRYTVARETLIARGLAVLQEGNAQYRGLCEQLVERTEFTGRSYSWGDDVIGACADGTVPPRAQRMWRGAATSHHLQFVTDQLLQRQRGARNDG
jgi:hypothetical protein